MSRGRNCCKCVTVSLVPTASLILVIVFACGIIVLPTLYIELSHEYKVSPAIGWLVVRALFVGNRLSNKFRQVGLYTGAVKVKLCLYYATVYSEGDG